MLFTVVHADDQPQDGTIKSFRGQCSTTFQATPSLEAEKTSDPYVLGENDDEQGYVLNLRSLKTAVDPQDADKVKEDKNYDKAVDQLHSAL